MHTRRKQLNTRFLISFLILIPFLLSACDTGANTGTKGVYNSAGGKGCNKIGVLLPETLSSDRWETKDHPLLIQAIKAALPNAQIDFTNALDNETTQITQANNDLAKGDCILVVAPRNSVTAATIVDTASALNVPVIAYDRLIQSKKLNYYVSFDNLRVGQLQGEYIAQHYQTYQKDGTVNMVMINGSQTDNNALLFSQGLHSAIDPLLANGSLKNVADTFTPDWTASNAQAEMEASLTDQQNDIQIAYVGNDNMADGVITALKNVNLNGKILVTGQDATLTGIRNIITGQQNMTIYKPIAKEAQSTGELLKAIYNGTNATALTQGQLSSTYDGGLVPSILDTPISIDRNNITQTVLADKYITKSALCAGLPAGTGGIC